MVRYMLKMYMFKNDLVGVRLKRMENCLTVRQWAVLCAILCLIFSAFLALFGSLITTHNQDIRELIDRDFENERAKHKPDDPLTPNEIKLRTSQKDVNWLKHEMDMFFWASYINFFSTILLCIGISVNNFNLVFQWIISSLILFIAATYLVLSYYMHMNFPYFWEDAILAAYVVLAPFFLVSWCVMLVYSLFEKITKIVEKSKENVVKSEGGLKHVVTMPEKLPL